MDSKIVVLDAHTANQIAAGEVVERPASVVKELVENAIDAGSTRIEIEITGGGLTTIKVTDNGEGMTPVDAELAFSRHATSKIQCASDLFKITTFGFRGEALPSIAAVSKVQLLTRTAASLEGTKLTLAGGKITGQEPCGCPAGTTVIVEDLFFNTPARQKFLKSTFKEAGAVADIVSRIALIHPQISFRLISDGRIILQTNGQNNLLTAIAQVYSTELAKKMLPVEMETESLRISGFIGQNFQHRASREMQNFFINKRYVHHLRLSKALEAGYQGTIPVKRYPICVLNLEIAPALIDVNVHPAKLEVRLEREEVITEQLTELVRATLEKKNRLPETGFRKVKYVPAGEQVSLNLPTLVAEQVKENFVTDNAADSEEKQAMLPATKEAGQSANSLTQLLHRIQTPTVPQPITSEQEQEKLPPMQVIGQLYDSYILAQGENGLYIIDQHAAHERIMYEEVLHKFLAKNNLSSQILAVPLTLELTYQETTKLVDNIFHFRSLGIIIEHFGGNTFLVRGIPVEFTPQEGEDLVTSLLVELQSKNPKEILYEDLLKIVACKKAVKAKKRLNLPEMEYLLHKLNSTKFPYSCPHGRPTIINLTLAELARRFLRT